MHITAKFEKKKTFSRSYRKPLPSNIFIPHVVLEKKTFERIIGPSRDGFPNET